MRYRYQSHRTFKTGISTEVYNRSLSVQRMCLVRSPIDITAPDGHTKPAEWPLEFHSCYQFLFQFFSFSPSPFQTFSSFSLPFSLLPSLFSPPLVPSCFWVFDWLSWKIPRASANHQRSWVISPAIPKHTYRLGNPGLESLSWGHCWSAPTRSQQSRLFHKLQGNYFERETCLDRA